MLLLMSQAKGASEQQCSTQANENTHNDNVFSSGFVSEEWFALVRMAVPISKARRCLKRKVPWMLNGIH
jgi:hypothetical protein